LNTRFPTRLILAAALITTLSLCAVTGVFYKGYRDLIDMDEHDSQLQSLSADILLFDEQLTSSALLAAHSGHHVWIDRYRDIEHQLVSAIGQVLNITHSNNIHDAVNYIDQANVMLVDMENLAFRKISIGANELALSLLSSAEYRTQKLRYSEGVSRMIEQIGVERETLVSNQHRLLGILVFVVLFSVAINIVLWTYVYRSIHQWRIRLLQEERRRSDAEEKLSALNEELEMRIDRRTSQLTESEKRLSYQANHDELTGTPNRRCSTTFLQQQLTTLKDNRLAVHLVDLDHFKRVNDTMGHAAGDELLKQTAKRLQLALGDQALVSRLGGDEFLIISELQPDTGSLKAGQAVLQCFQPPFYLVAKEQGRNSVCLFTTDMNEKLNQRLALESKLRVALERGDQFQLYYQPQINVQEGTVAGTRPWT